MQSLYCVSLEETQRKDGRRGRRGAGEREGRGRGRRGVGEREGEEKGRGEGGGRVQPFLTLLSTRYSTCLNTTPFFSGIRVTAISSIDLSSSYVYPSWFGCVALNSLMQESRSSATLAKVGVGSSVQENG